jgi:hypothetical protein
MDVLDTTPTGQTLEFPPNTLQPESLPNFPSELRALLDVIVHAGVCVLDDLEKSVTQPATALVILTVNKTVSQPKNDPLDRNLVTTNVAHLHIFSYAETDRTIDDPGRMNGLRGISQFLKSRERLEKQRIPLGSETEIMLLNQGRIVIGNPDAAESFKFYLAEERIQKEWLLQLRTILAELAWVQRRLHTFRPVLNHDRGL